MQKPAKSRKSSNENRNADGAADQLIPAHANFRKIQDCPSRVLFDPRPGNATPQKQTD